MAVSVERYLRDGSCISIDTDPISKSLLSLPGARVYELYNNLSSLDKLTEATRDALKRLNILNEDGSLPEETRQVVKNMVSPGTFHDLYRYVVVSCPQGSTLLFSSEKVTTDFLKERWDKIEGSSLSLFQALLIPRRVTNTTSFLKDLFLPATYETALKTDGLVLKILKTIASFAVDLATFPIRLVTAIPRAYYVATLCSEVYNFLLEKNISKENLGVACCFRFNQVLDPKSDTFVDG